MDQKNHLICILSTQCNKHDHPRKATPLLVMVLLVSIGEQVLLQILIIRHQLRQVYVSLKLRDRNPGP